jgi:hypothetical protein
MRGTGFQRSKNPSFLTMALDGNLNIQIEMLPMVGRITLHIASERTE